MAFQWLNDVKVRGYRSIALKKEVVVLLSTIMETMMNKKKVKTGGEAIMAD